MSLEATQDQTVQLQRATAQPMDHSAIPEEDASDILVSVVMPCLNEARTLAACIKAAHAGCQAALAQQSRLSLPDNSTPQSRLLLHDNSTPQSRLSLRESSAEQPSGATQNASGANATASTYEIIIADNGSTDGSQEIAIEHGASVVDVETKGYGAALLGGIVAARGKYIVMGDSDCSYDFGEVPRFVDKLQEGYDLVVGNRFTGGIEPGAMPWHHRYIGNPLLSGLGRLLYRTPIRDWHCGLRAFDRQKINTLRLTSSGMEFASELVLRAAREQFPATNIAVKLHPDGRNRPPHLRSFRDGWRHLSLLTGMRELARKSEDWMLGSFAVVFAALLCLAGTLKALGIYDSVLQEHAVELLGVNTAPVVISELFLAACSIFCIQRIGLLIVGFLSAGMCWAAMMIEMGLSSCGCFGWLSISPWGMLLLDAVLLLVAGTLIYRTKLGLDLKENMKSLLWLAMFCCTGFCIQLLLVAQLGQ